MKKINWRSIGETAKDVCGIVGCALIFGLPRIIEVVHVTEERKDTDKGYSDTVKAILNSNIWSSDKSELISVLKRNLDSDIYSTMIDIAKDNRIWTSDKVELIMHLNNPEDES